MIVHLQETAARFSAYTVANCSGEEFGNPRSIYRMYCKLQSWRSEMRNERHDDNIGYSQSHVMGNSWAYCGDHNSSSTSLPHWRSHLVSGDLFTGVKIETSATGDGSKSLDYEMLGRRDRNTWQARVAIQALLSSTESLRLFHGVFRRKFCCRVATTQKHVVVGPLGLKGPGGKCP